MPASALLQTLSYSAVTALCLVAGAVTAGYSIPSAKTQSLIQHVAAGFVFAAAGVEVLPEVIGLHLPLAAAIGFAVGVCAMLGIQALSKRLEEGEGGESAWGFVAVVVVDLFVDGLLIGVTSTAERGDAQNALLIAIALGVELLALGLSMGASFMEGGSTRSRTTLIAAGVALAPIVGSIAGYFLGGVLTGPWIEGVLAFAVAALLYLAAEELLVEAHEVPETPLSALLFFSGFLAVLVIDMVAAGA